MKMIKYLVLALLVAFSVPALAQHRGGGHHGGGHWVVPFVVGAGVGYVTARSYYAPPQPVYYPSWYVESPQVVYAPQPTYVPVQPGPAMQRQNVVLLFCDATRLWYYTGATCPQPWREVITAQ